MQSQDELANVCAALRAEVKKFVKDHELVQGLLVTYSQMNLTAEGSIRAETSVGRKAVEDLKQRLADMGLEQALPINLDNHLLIFNDCTPTQSGNGRLQTENAKHPFMGALCIERAVMKRKSVPEGGTEVKEENVI